MAGTHRPFLRTHWVTLVTLAAFAAMFFFVRWVVKTQRSPGSITVVEAQGMDMGAMKAPPGVQPVGSEAAQFRQIGDNASFPATVMAYSDEEVVARVPGRVLSLAYPGDHIISGQIVARLDAQEYLAQAGQAQFAAKSGTEQIAVAGHEVERRRAMKTQAMAGVDAATATITKAQADRVVAIAEQHRMKSEVDSKAALVKDREAEALYANQNRDRKERLYGAGVISLNEYQVAQASRDSANAKVDSAKADAVAAIQAAQAATARVAAAGDEVKQAQALARVARSAVGTADKDVEVARAQVASTRALAQSTSSQSNSASIIAGYTQLRALDDAMVSERFVSPGGIVTAGQKLLMLHVATKVRIQAQLPQTLIASVTEGTPVVIHYGDLTRSAKLTSIFPTADAGTRTFTAEAIVPNPGHQFLPGSFATMSVQTSSEEKQLSVRSSAVQTDASGNRFVWIVSQLANGQETDWTCPMHTEVSEPGPGKCPICKMELVPRGRSGKTVASRRSVTTGGSDGSYTAVTSGIKPGDEVIWAGFEALVEGSPVRSTAWGANGPQDLPKVGASPGNTGTMPGMQMEGAAASTGQKDKPKATEKEAQPLYTCPMHPEVVQDHPGKCPKCGMELVLKKAVK